ncbi:MAG: hypothetical protein U5K29_13980 [Acidimicrobiales bacterium]|nr:hypothetical protein [Acidimicrobiales bacterium]
MPEHRVNLTAGTVGRDEEWSDLLGFVDSDAKHSTLAIMWGRRRIGKSFLLGQLAEGRGLYYEAIRGTASEALSDLGRVVGETIGAPGPLNLPDWETAIDTLMRLGEDNPFVVVLDEFPYLLEESPELESIIQRAFNPKGKLRNGTRCRLVLCGSAISVMAKLLAGTAPLRGRAGLDLRMSPFDYRDALGLYPTDDLLLATHLYSIIGGVAAYARDMVDNDLPKDRKDLARWVAHRVLAPSAPLSREAEVLLSEDPTTAQARKPNLYHAVLAATALGHRTPAKINDYAKLSGPRLDPILTTLVGAQFIERLVDPTKSNRPRYFPGDSIIRFHYAVIRPNQPRLRTRSAATAFWPAAEATFRSKVVGPTFEGMARHWATQYATIPGLAGPGTQIGATTVSVDGAEYEVDLVAARDGGDSPGERTITALGEAKSGEDLTFSHLNKLERFRDTLGDRATDATLVLFGTRFAKNLVARTKDRGDVELVDLERLYMGS